MYKWKRMQNSEINLDSDCFKSNSVNSFLNNGYVLDVNKNKNIFITGNKQDLILPKVKSK